MVAKVPSPLLSYTVKNTKRCQKDIKASKCLKGEIRSEYSHEEKISNKAHFRESIDGDWY